LQRSHAAPAFRRADLAPATAGAPAGMTIGILAWTYTLLLPSFADAGIVGKAC
jgi:hypothetical protein